MNKLPLKITAIAVFLIGYGQQAQSCIDPDTISTIDVAINYGSVNSGGCFYVNELEVRLSNLKLMTESPGVLCACAFAQISTFDSVTYIAFVDSGTNDPYQGFAAFNEELASSTAWDGDQPGFGGWTGFVANVVNSGLSATAPVELVIRLSASVGSILASVDSFCLTPPAIQIVVPQISIATDEWIPGSSSLGNVHQGTRGLNTNTTYQSKSASYFTTLDNDIIPNIPVVSVPLRPRPVEFSVVPNPFSNSMTVSVTTGQQISAYQIHDLEGKLVRYESGLSEDKITIERGSLSRGMYFLELSSEKDLLGRQKIVIQ
ncbi:MAG: T9SS type A sorting domain-containing protein [Flavobacteriales bacterium]|nr:T9SS type A sorting domain-containing protein [Flavobacteriales bacterium]